MTLLLRLFGYFLPQSVPAWRFPRHRGSSHAMNEAYWQRGREAFERQHRKHR